MTREDWIWVAIKVIGIYVGVEAVLTLPNLLYSFRMIQDPSGRFAENVAASAGLLGFWHLLARFILLATVSIYFLRSGRLVLWLIASGKEARAK
jgi:hypothetical protein